MTAANDPDQQVYRHVRETFGSEALAVVYIEDQALFARSRLEKIEALIYRLEQIKGIDRVESLFSIPSVSYQNDAVYVGPIIAELPGTDSEARRLRERAVQNPLAAGRMLSKDGKATTINLYLEHRSDESNWWLELAGQIESTLQPFHSDFETIFQIGRPMAIKTQADLIAADQKRLILPAIVVLFATLWLMAGTVNAAVMPLLTGGLSIYWTLGFMGACGFPITVLTFIVPSLILIIGATEDIHLIATFRQDAAGADIPREAVSRMAEHTGRAVFFTSLTTTVGFLTIAFHDTLVMRQFGLTAAFGMAANFIATILVAPPYLGRICWRYGRKRPPRFHFRFYSKMAEGIHGIVGSRKNRIAIAIPVLLALSLGYWGTKLEMDTDLLKIFEDDAPIVKHARILNARLSGTGAFYVHVDSHQPGTFREPSPLERLEAFQLAIDNLDIADHTFSVVDYLHLIHRAFNHEEDGRERLPSERATIAEYLLFIHPLELGRMVKADFSEAVIMVRHQISSTRQLAEALERIGEATAGIFPPTYTVKPVGEFVLVQRAMDKIVRSQLFAVVSLSLLVAILIGSYYRNPMAGLLALIPILFPVVMIYGIMGALDIPLDIGTSLVVPVAIGIAVDDTIHLLVRFRDCRKIFRDPREAMKKTLQSEVAPVTSTTVALAAGFAILALSGFVPIRLFGSLAALAMLIALICDLILTPMLFFNIECKSPGVEPTDR